MSSGRTAEEARQALAEAVRLFLITVIDIGTLEEVLQESGHEFVQGNWVGPEWVALERPAMAVK
jgi:hypothetical protein